MQKSPVLNNPYEEPLCHYATNQSGELDYDNIAGKGDVIVMPASDYENIKETIYILKDKVTMASIMKTRLELKTKEFNGKKIEEVFTDVMEPENK